MPLLPPVIKYDFSCETELHLYQLLLSCISSADDDGGRVRTIGNFIAPAVRHASTIPAKTTQPTQLLSRNARKQRCGSRPRIRKYW